MAPATVHLVRVGADDLGPVSARAKELEDRVDGLVARERELREAADAARQEVVRVARVLVDAYAAHMRAGHAPDTAPEAKRLTAELAKAKAKAAEPWAQKIEAAGQAAQAAQAEQQAFLAENLPALVAERLPRAEASGPRVEDALRVLLATLDERARLVRELEDVVQAVHGPGRGRVPGEHELERLRSEVERVLGAGVAVPVPPEVMPEPAGDGGLRVLDPGRLAG
jgi:hypothetical protein